MKNRIFLNKIGYFEAFLVFIAILLASFFIVKNSKAVTFNEPVDVNSSLGVDLTSYLQEGAQIGVISGQGGVLFANGTIINASEGVVPVTFGDDMRVDGELWRGPNKGISDNQALKVSDYLLPTMTNMNDLGAPHHRWKDFYYAGTMYGEDAIIGRELWGGSRKGIVDNDDPLYVSDSMYPTMDDINDLGSEDNRWQDAYFSGDVQVGNTLGSDNIIVSGTTRMGGSNSTPIKWHWSGTGTTGAISLGPNTCSNFPLSLSGTLPESLDRTTDNIISSAQYSPGFLTWNVYIDGGGNVQMHYCNPAPGAVVISSNSYLVDIWGH